MARPWRDEFISYVEESIKRGGASSSGSSVPGWIDNAVYKTLKYVKASSQPVEIRAMHDVIHNLVLDSKQASVNKTAEERLYGTLLVLSSDTNTGWLQEEQKKVIFESLLSVYTGEEVPYSRQGKKYIAEKAHTGSTSGGILRTYGVEPNLLVRSGPDSSTYEFNPLLDDPGLFDVELTAGKTVPGGEHIWLKDKGTYGYFDGTVYRETFEDVATVDDIAIDCAAYMFSASAAVPFTNGGISYNRYPGTTRTMKVLFYGKYRLVIIARFHWTEVVGQSAAVSEVGIFDLLILNTETGTVTKHGYTHSAFTTMVCPVGVYAGYVDVQINKENGKLLLLKSAANPTTTTIAVKYYNDADPVTDPQIYDHTTNATVYRIPFDLDEVTISSDGLTFDFVQNLYSHDGVVSLIDGVSVTGGITSCMFTQQPESFNIYIQRHLVAYKQQATVPTTPAEVLEAYRLTSYGRWEFYGVTEGSVQQAAISPHSTACGTKTTTAVTDMAVAVVPNYYVDERMKFIREFIPARDRTQVDNLCRFFEHLGANYSARDSKEDLFTTRTGSSAVNLGYATDRASQINDARFFALTDSVTSEVKFITLSRAQEIYSYDPYTDPFTPAQTQGLFFFKNNIESFEMPMLSAIGVDKSDRWDGFYFDDVDGTLLYDTYGTNNVGAEQFTDDVLVSFVSRAERIEYTNYPEWTSRQPATLTYDKYFLYSRAMNGGLAGGTIDIIHYDSQDMQLVVDLALLETLTSLVYPYTL